MTCCSRAVAMSGYVRRRSKAKFALIGNRNANVGSMNGPVAVHLGDSLPSAATEKIGLHHSVNKEDLAAAKGQEFSNLFFAAQGKGNSTASSPQTDLEKEPQDLKADEEPEAESVENEIAVVAPSVSLPTLNPVAQSVLSPHATSSKDANDTVENSIEPEKSKTEARTEKSEISSDVSSPLLGISTNNVTEAVLIPASLPIMFSTAKLESTAVTGEKGEQDPTGSSAHAKISLGSSAVDKSGSARAVDEVSSTVAVGRQEKLAESDPAIVDGDVPDDTVSDASAEAKPTATTAKAESSVDLTGAKNGIDGAAGVVSSASSAATAAAVSNTTDLDQKAAASAVSPTSAAVTGSTVVPTHDVTASVPPAGVATPAAPPTQGAQTAATHDPGPLTPKSDGLERTASTNSGPGSADAHALLDGTTTGGRDGTWQITSNRVEAGFANGQDSWTSVVAQRQQGHVTAMVELTSAAEHGTTTSMLPQLSAHLAERQVSVDQLGVSVRQQFASGQDASAANQGQQSNQSSQSQRGQQAVTAAVSPVTSAPTDTEQSRISLDGNRISIRA
jgi:uncharacterized protein YccT (UPF0319 family)